MHDMAERSQQRQGSYERRLEQSASVVADRDEDSDAREQSC